MKSLWMFVESIFVIAGLPIACLVGYIMAADIVFFWQHGMPRQAIVKRIVQEDHGVRSESYEYLFDMGGREISRIFTVQLPVGKHVDILVSPDGSEAFILGNKDHNLFELFALNIGGKAIAILIIAVYLIIIYFTFLSLIRWIKNRGKLLER